MPATADTTTNNNSRTPQRTCSGTDPKLLTEHCRIFQNSLKYLGFGWIWVSDLLPNMIFKARYIETSPLKPTAQRYSKTLKIEPGGWARQYGIPASNFQWQNKLANSGRILSGTNLIEHFNVCWNQNMADAFDFFDVLSCFASCAECCLSVAQSKRCTQTWNFGQLHILWCPVDATQLGANALPPDEHRFFQWRHRFGPTFN